MMSHPPSQSYNITKERYVYFKWKTKVGAEKLKLFFCFGTIGKLNHKMKTNKKAQEIIRKKRTIFVWATRR